MRVAILSLMTCITFSASAAMSADRPILSKAQLKPVSGVDLEIADDETYRRPNSWAENDGVGAGTALAAAKLLPTERVLAGGLTGPASRPGMSIAWRNAAQVEEVEVRVRNLGTMPGEGRIWVDILDESGGLLLHLEPPEELRVIRLPAFDQGGREGKVLRMKASRELNNLIDRFDNEHRRYNVRATIEAVGAKDVNPVNNAKVKSWNVDHRVRQNSRTSFNYVFKNHLPHPVRVKWLFERTPYPPGWKVQGVPASNAPFALAPGQEVRGSLWLDAPKTIAEGAFLESRIGLINTADGSLFGQHEWFLVYDTIPPQVTNYRMVFTADHRIAIQALVADQGSGVLEATGVSTEYSTDGGLTWSRRAHNYKSGNFVIPTLFEAVLGPFAPETDVQLRFTAKDTGGNATSVIPDDATALIAPPQSEKLISFAYVFPRNHPNPIFTLEPGREHLGNVATRFASALAAGPPADPSRVSELSDALMAMRITPENKNELLSAARRLAENPETVTAGRRLEDVINSVTPDEPPQEVEVKTALIERVSAPASDLLKMSTLRVRIP